MICQYMFIKNYAEKKANDAQNAAASDATSKDDQVKIDLIGSNEHDTKDSITIWGARKHADDIENVVTSQADLWSSERANNAKTEAIKAAASDATTKANNAKTEAISEAKKYTDGELGKLKTRVEALESAFSTLAQNVGSLVTITNGE